MKKILFIVAVVICLVIINNLIRSIYDVWSKKDFVVKAEKELNYQKQENQRLKSQLRYSETLEFIEKEARDKLFLVKKDEQKVLIPQEQENLHEVQKKDNDPNWKKWRNLFF